MSFNKIVQLHKMHYLYAFFSVMGEGIFLSSILLSDNTANHFYLMLYDVMNYSDIIFLAQSCE